MGSRLRRLVVPGALVSLIAASCVLTFAEQALAQTDATITIEAFVGRLDAATLLATDGTTDPTPSTMNDLRATLGLPVTVVTPSGLTRIPVDEYLDSLPGESAQDFINAADHLGALRDAATAAGTLGAIPPTEQIHESLDAANAGRSEPAADTKPSWLSRFLDWLFGKTGAAASSIDTFLRVLVWIIAAVILGVFIWLIWKLRPTLIPSRTQHGTDETEPREASAGRDRRRAVHDAVAAGDFVEAVRISYHLMIRTLTRRGFVPRIPGLTSGECRGSVARTKPEIGDAVGDATRVFERVIYGKKPAQQSDVDAILDADRKATRV